MKVKFYAVAIAVVLLWPRFYTLHAQCVPSGTSTFTNSTPVAISASGTPVITSTITVSGAPTYLTDLNVRTFITHTFSSDLDVTITSPSGTIVTLTTDNGSTFDDVFNGTLWDDDADPGTTVPNEGNNNFVREHTYANLTLASPLVPEEGLGAFTGENPNGTWTITVADDSNLDGGSLNSWSLILSGLSAAPTLTTSTFTNNTPVAISATGTPVVTSTIVVSGLGAFITDVNALTNITHTFSSDLDITITSPSGTIVTLSTDNGSTFDNVFNGTVWDDDADPSGTVPNEGNNNFVSEHTYADLTTASPLVPEEPLSAFIGENPNGVWTITVADDSNLDGGSLNAWSLTFATGVCGSSSVPCSPSVPVSFTNNTPIAISPTGTPVVTSTIVVIGAPVFLTDLNVTTFITHTFSSDLDITITSPSGTVVTLTSDNGSTFDNVFNGTVWDDDADPGTTVPNTADNNFVREHTYADLTLASPLVPEEGLGAFNGENPNGVWTITVSDDSNLDGGSLDSWSLALSGLSAVPTQATSTFTNSTPVAISPTGTPVVTSTIVVSGMSPFITDVNALTSIMHTFSSDLDITITSPAGTIVTLTTDNGSTFDNVYNGTTWDDDADPLGTVPGTGNGNDNFVVDHAYVDLTTATPLVPEEPLSAFVGEDPNGVWTITVADDSNLDGGSLNSWSLVITASTCVAPVCNVTCPANIIASNDPGLCSAVVNYPAPTSSGTCGPIVTFPASGSVFPSGVNTVNAYNSANQKVYGLTIASELVSFTLGSPGTASAPIAITGMQAGEFMAGIDFRPANGLLYGIAVGGGGTTGRLYSINTTTGAATQVGAATFAVNGSEYGMDYNPTVDRIRFITNAGMNMRINPNDGTLTALDVALNPGTPNVMGAAYTNNFNGATTTTLYDIDATTDQLYIQNPPNNGTLVAVGPLGINATALGEFDITQTNNAYAILQVGANSALYSINLTTGAATSAGALPGTYRGMAIAPLSTITPSCSFTITVNDTQVPTITCPGNITVNNDLNVCGATVNTNNPTTADNCAVTKLTWALTGATTGTSPATGINNVGSRLFNVGVTTVTYTVSDAAGNNAVCSFTVTVNDTQNPTITCPANITAPNTLNLCSASVVTPNPTNTDNCAVTVRTWALTGATTGASPATGLNNVGTQTFNVGVTTVTYTVKDAAGNTGTCSFTVTVNDTQNPVINCPGNIAVTTPIGSCTVVVNYTVTASDNCPGVTTALQSGLASGTAFPIGVTTVTWKATDAAGNSATCSFTVTVTDGQLPVISQQPQTVTACAGSNVTFSVTATNTLSYQWQFFNGTAFVNVPGATSSTLTINNVNISMNTNTYRVNVTGLCTTVASNPATLFVNPLPAVTINPSIPPALLPGQSVTLTAIGTPAGGSFLWFKDGVSTGITGSVLAGLTVDDIGSYTVRYTDPKGCVSVSTAVAVTGMASGNMWVYPNPNYGQFQVRFYNGNPENATVRVFNSAGQRVFEKAVVTTLPYTQIDIDLGAKAASDVYVVELINQAGKRVGAQKVVVRH